MRKFGISIIMAVLVLVVTTVPVLACGDEDVYVELSDIDLDGETRVGQSVTVSGTVTIVSRSEAIDHKAYAEARSKAGYAVTNPIGKVVDNGSQHEYDNGWGFCGSFPAEADASQVFCWESTVFLDYEGNWLVEHCGSGEAWWLGLGQCGSDLDEGYGQLVFNVRPNSDYWLRGFQVILRNGNYCTRQVYDKDPDPESFYLYEDLLGEPVSQQVSGIDSAYKLEIEKGTRITSGGCRANQLKIFIFDGEFYSSGDLELSRDAVIYQSSNSGWTEVLRFTNIVDGVIVE